MWTQISAILALLRARFTALREEPEAGYSTEAVVATALLVGLALLVVGVIIYNKVVEKAKGISL